MTTRTKHALPGDPAKAVAYIRGSDAKQALTPAVQRAAITAYASSNGFEVVSWHEETVCSVTEVELRVALTGALAAVVEHGAGILVVAKRDRLARDVVISSLLGRLLSVGFACLGVWLTTGSLSRRELSALRD